MPLSLDLPILDRETFVIYNNKLDRYKFQSTETQRFRLYIHFIEVIEQNMVQPLPPPRTYRAKTRLARCRARQKALRKSSSGSNSNEGTRANDCNGENEIGKFQMKSPAQKKIDTSGEDVPSPWVQFDSGTDISTSWSGESEAPEAVEVEINRAPAIHSRWISEPINDDMQEVPVIPLPAPSSVSQNRASSRLSGAPPLRPRDTNAIPRTRGGRSTLNSSNGNNSFDGNGKMKGPQLKVVSRPIESSRGRGGRGDDTRRARSTSRSRRTRGRSRSIIRVNMSEHSKSDSSLGSEDKNPETSSRSMETIASKDENSSVGSSGSRSRRRRERSLSILRARRNGTRNTTISTTRSRSLSVTSSRSASTAKIGNLKPDKTNDHDHGPELEQQSSSSMEESDTSTISGPRRQRFSSPARHSRLRRLESPPPAKFRTRGQSLDPRSYRTPGLTLEPHSRRNRGQSLEPQPLRTERQSLEPQPLRTERQSLEPQPIANPAENGNSTNTTVAESRYSVSLPSPFLTRTLLTSSVYHNQATGIWITTINMNQRSNVTRSNAAKYLKAFSFQTEREARESAYANAPAKMAPFDANPRCFMCDTKFAVLRRASHCRNCGVCICNSCSVSWNKLSVPETFNVKNEKSIKVCKSCDSLSKMFRKSLVDADYERALTIYNTGNINLRCQFMTMKGAEAMLPIHCAAEGGSLRLLQWLVDVHFCPIKRIRTGNRNKQNLEDELITTSKGRSILEIAMAGKHVDILNYLVNDKKISFDGIRSLDVALGALEAVLFAFPNRHEIESEQEEIEIGSPEPSFDEIDRPRHTPIRNGIPLYEISSNDTDADDESTDTSSYTSDANGMDSDDDESVATTVRDAVSVFVYLISIFCSFYLLLNEELETHFESILFLIFSVSFATKIQSIALLLLVGIKSVAYSAVRI